MKSIQTKFITLILGCVLLSSAVIGGAGISKARKVVDGDSAQIMNLMCSEKAKELDSLFSRVEQSVKTLSVYTLDQLDSLQRLKTDPVYLDEYTQALQQVAVNAASNTEGAVAVYVRYNPEILPPASGLFWIRSENTGRFDQFTPTDLSAYSPADKTVGWYYIPVENKKATWLEPYTNKSINVKMISYVIPIFKDNETVGIVGMDINFEMIAEDVNKIKLYQSGYAFLTNDQGQIMSHKEILTDTRAEQEDESLTQIVAALKKSSSGSSLFEYTWRGTEKKMAFRTLQNGLRLVVTAPVEEIDSEKDKLITEILTAVLFISVLTVLLTVIFTRRLIRPLKELNEAAKKIAAGDFSVSFSRYARDEVGALAASFQKTSEHLQQYISYINGLAYRDALTGVKNKTAYQDAVLRLEEQIKTGRAVFALVILDLNGLKQANDTYGHDFGDTLITEACRLICKTFKRSPVYRIGGDEFAVILEGPDLEQCSKLIKSFEDGMAEHNRTARPGNYISVAWGIAVYNGDTDQTFSTIFKRADEAMYKNKAAVKMQGRPDKN